MTGRSTAGTPDSTQLLVIATPVSRVDGMIYGGILRIRTPFGPAYAAFPDRDLAMRVAEHWSISSRAKILPWMQSLAHEPDESRAGQLLVFSDMKDFIQYIKEREAYPFADRLVPLGPRPHATGDEQE